MHAWKSKSKGHGTLFGLNVIKIWQPLEIGAQMRGVERTLETLPSERLRLVCAPERFHHIEAHFLPFERNPARPVLGNSVDGAPGLLGAARLQKSLGDF